MEQLDSIEMVILAAFVLLPANVASLTWRSVGDLRSHGAEEDRKGGLAIWAAIHGVLILLFWSRIRWVVEHLRGGNVDAGEVGLLVLLLLVAPCGIGLLMGGLAKWSWTRAPMSSLGLIGPRATTPWDRFTANDRITHVLFRDARRPEMEFRGMVSEYDTEGEQVLLDCVERRCGDGEWENDGDVTGALLFGNARVLWFAQRDVERPDVLDREFVDPWASKWRLKRRIRSAWARSTTGFKNWGASRKSRAETPVVPVATASPIVELEERKHEGEHRGVEGELESTGAPRGSGSGEPASDA